MSKILLLLIVMTATGLTVTGCSFHAHQHGVDAHLL
jgi:hypothetical protein